MSEQAATTTTAPNTGNAPSPENEMPPPYTVGNPQHAADNLDAKDAQFSATTAPNQPPMMPQPTVVQQPVTTTCVIANTIGLPVFGDQPIQVRCHQCLQTVITSTEKSLRDEAYIWACVLCFFTGLLCCWIPFVMDSMYKTIHKCPVCHAYQGTYHK